MDQDKNAGVVFLMWLLPFEEIYVTAAKILGLDEITLRILSARHQHWSERRARDGGQLDSETGPVSGPGSVIEWRKGRGGGGGWLYGRTVSKV